MSLHDALGSMRALQQWFVWRLTWDGVEGKYQKMPTCGDAQLPANWITYDAACALRAQLDVDASGYTRYALGFMLTRECGYWFLDLDHAAGSEWAAQLVATYPGALTERSSSGTGMHVIGKLAVPVDERHRCKPPREIAARIAPVQIELYTHSRGICFGLDGVAQGSADHLVDMRPTVAAYFPPRVPGDSSARPEWRGPADDDVLIQKMLSAKLSAEAAFGGKPSLARLWAGDCEHKSEQDMALASHLAFWTGCDEERIARLMRRSGLVRDKWNDPRPGGTYLTYTIERACESCDNVYQEPQRSQVAQQEMFGTPVSVLQTAPGTAPGGELISAELFAKCNALLDQVGGCGDELTFWNSVIPAVQQAGVPGAMQERIVSAVKDKLWSWGNKMQIGKLRAMLFPPILRGSAGQGDLPEWAHKYCWVTSKDMFYNVENGEFMSMVSFQATYGRYMGLTEQGKRENACEKCLHFWGMNVVERVGYRPDLAEFYQWNGVSYANGYSTSSIPPAVDTLSDKGRAGIEGFQWLLWNMCGQREAVYLNLLYWYAHNVQKPGVKIRWAPILKGVNGDGKTLITTVLRAVMGFRNVCTTSNANLKNSGGFTDWAVRGAVNVIEEIYLVGTIRHQLYNGTKEFITNNIVDVNPKGATPYQTWNCTNHYANTNHNDALPMEKEDRRWFVVFTPWSSLRECYAYCKTTEAEWRARVAAIDAAYKDCPGELRAWFLSIPIPATFDIDGSAMMTPEKMRMMASGADDADTAAASIIMNGGVGITENVISSSHLSKLLEIEARASNFELPRGMALNHMLTRMGYSKMDKQVKWIGKTWTIWLKDGVSLSNDDVRQILDDSNQTQTLLTH